MAKELQEFPRVIEIVVSDNKATLNLDGELVIQDLTPDMDQVASQMAFWAEVWGAAVEEEQIVDAYYRQWRAQVGEQFNNLSEAKQKIKIEGHPKFLEFKRALGRCQRNVIRAKGFHDSFARKANVLQTRGAMDRQGMSATGMVTRSDPELKEKAKQRSEDDRKSALRGVLGKKKA